MQANTSRTKKNRSATQLLPLAVGGECEYIVVVVMARSRYSRNLISVAEPFQTPADELLLGDDEPAASRIVQKLPSNLSPSGRTHASLAVPEVISHEHDNC
jgi:hypothetical protein